MMYSLPDLGNSLEDIWQIRDVASEVLLGMAWLSISWQVRGAKV